MRIQLWSSNYDPEPQGIAPLSSVLARGLTARGHHVQVVAAHPHYPEPAWGTTLRPYSEVRGGVEVIRLPIWAGRKNGLARIRQELSFTAAQAAAAPFLGRPDVVVAVSPSFSALSVAMASCKARRIPWVMWLQDIVTDGAATTGQLEDGGRILEAARRFERASYRSASRVVAISDAFRDNLIAKGIPARHVVRIFNPVSRPATEPIDLDHLLTHSPQLLAMGNIGHTQGLHKLVGAFESSHAIEALDARLVIAGSGVAAAGVRDAVTTDRVSMPGVLYGEELTPVLRSSTLGVVSQRSDITEFNLPSKLMNYMSHGVPVLASVNPRSETARIVRESGAGWVTDAETPEAFATEAARVLGDREALQQASRRGFAFARDQFSPATIAAQFESVLEGVLDGTRSSPRPATTPHGAPTLERSRA